MKTRKLVSATLLALCLAPLGAVTASDSEVNNLPEAQSQNGVSYLSGGVGEDQAKAIESAARDYSLMLTFATQKTGEYLADVKVNIADRKGQAVLDTVADGPMLLVKLQPGEYRISAVSNDRPVNKTIRIGKGHTTRVTLHWPDHEVK